MRWITALATLAVAVSTPAPAEQPKPLFAASDPIHIVIQAPIPALARKRSSDAAIEGTLTDPGGQPLPIASPSAGLRAAPRTSASSRR